MRQGRFRITGRGLRTWVLVTGFALFSGCASVDTGTVTMVSKDVFLVSGHGKFILTFKLLIWHVYSLSFSGSQEWYEEKN